jgi:hypothetical protein
MEEKAEEGRGKETREDGRGEGLTEQQTYQRSEHQE